MKVKSFNLLFKMPDRNFFIALFLSSRVEEGITQPYIANVEIVDQKNDSCTFSSVKPNNSPGDLFLAVQF